MSFGASLLTSDGTPSFDLSRDGYSFVEVVSATAGSSGSRSYPELAGWQVFATVVQDASTGSVFTDVASLTVVNVSVSYAAGYPAVSWSYGTSVGSPQPVALFIMAH